MPLLDTVDSRQFRRRLACSAALRPQTYGWGGRITRATPSPFGPSRLARRSPALRACVEPLRFASYPPTHLRAKPPCGLKHMAGAGGFEPPMPESKSGALTAWPRPKCSNLLKFALLPSFSARIAIPRLVPNPRPREYRDIAFAGRASPSSGEGYHGLPADRTPLSSVARQWGLQLVVAGCPPHPCVRCDQVQSGVAQVFRLAPLTSCTGNPRTLGLIQLRHSSVIIFDQLLPP